MKLATITISTVNGRTVIEVEQHQDAAAATETITPDGVLKKAQELLKQEGGKDKLKQIIAEFDASRLSQIADEKLPAVYERIEQCL